MMRAALATWRCMPYRWLNISMRWLVRRSRISTRIYVIAALTFAITIRTHKTPTRKFGTTTRTNKIATRIYVTAALTFVTAILIHKTATHKYETNTRTNKIAIRVYVTTALAFVTAIRTY